MSIIPHLETVGITPNVITVAAGNRTYDAA